MVNGSARGNQSVQRSIARIVLPYAGFAALWILLSDRALDQLVPGAAAYSAFSTIKGLCFVAVTAGLLWMLLRLELTRRATAERALQLTTEQLERAQQVAHLGIWSWDIPNDRLTWSDQMFAIFGISREAFVGDLRGIALGAIHPDDRDRVVAANRAVLTGEPARRIEYRVVWPDGTVRTVWAEGADLTADESGRPLQVTGIVQDITERSLVERQLLRAQRSQAAGALASGIAHDLNNVLTPVMMIAPLLRDRVTEDEDKEMLDTLDQAAQRGSAIIGKLLTFARGEPTVRTRLAVRGLVNEMEKIAKDTFPRDIVMQTDLPPDLWDVAGDATLLHQVLLNLCLNARDAMPQGGRLTISAANVTLDEQEVVGDVVAGPFVRLTVSDVGTGIAAEHLDRIFDPFFTTKDVGKGTGLGLSSVMGIVRGHQGFVRVESLPGQGSRFDVYLPAHVR